MKEQLRVCFILSVILCALPLFSSAYSLSDNKIVVVADDKYPPFFFRDDKGELQGILVDQWKLWSERTGIDVDIQAMDWNKAQELMAEGKADVIDVIFYTEKRVLVLDYTKPYENIEVPVFFNRNISGINSIKSLAGFIIGVKKGDADIDILKSKGISNLMEFSSYESIVRAASNNLINVFCIDKPPALYYLYKMNIAGQFKYSFTLSTGQLHRAVRKGRGKLLSIVEKGFSEIPESKYREINRKWLGNDLDNNNIINYLYYSLILILLISIIFSLWNYTLRKRIAEKTLEIRKTMEEKNNCTEMLMDRESEYKNIFENAPVGIFQSTLKGKFLSINPALAVLFDYESAEDMLQSIADIPGQMFVNPVARKDLIQRVLNTGGFVRSEVEYYRKDKTKFTANLYMRAVRDRRGSVIYLEGFVEDITDRKTALDALRKSEKNLLEANQTLEKANRDIRIKDIMLLRSERLSSLGQLSSAIAHEIRQPLNNIKLISEGFLFWKEENLDISGDDIYKGLSDISRNIERMDKTLKTMMNMVRAPEKIESRPVIINQVVRDTAALMDQKIKDSGIELRLDLDRKMKEIEISDVQIQQVLINIISNAVKILSDCGLKEKFILIETEDLKEKIVIQISDNGPGVPEENREKIFNPFFSTRQSSEDMGLGLYVVNTIIKSYNSEVFVRGNEWGGATFVIRLNRAEKL